MDSKLTITWDGNVPGLPEHRLSVDAFGDALKLLLIAYRRIASNMLREAVGAEGKADKRLRKTASWLDLQIVDVLANSSGIAAAGVLTVPPGESRNLFEDLSTRAGIALLEAIEAEAHGHLQSKAVRNYLGALPVGITHQRYKFSANGTTRKEIEFGDLELANTNGEMPHLLEATGQIISVGFEPGEPFIQIDCEHGKMRFSATAEQVESAISLRGRVVSAVAVARGKRARLLNVRLGSEEVEPLTSEQIEETLFVRWDELLKRLAK